MEHQLELGYLVIQVPEPDSLNALFADVIGLIPGEPTPTGSHTWRNDRRAHRLIVEPGAANDAVALGFEAIDVQAFDRTVARLQSTGLVVIEDNGAAER